DGPPRGRPGGGGRGRGRADGGEPDSVPGRPARAVERFLSGVPVRIPRRAGRRGARVGGGVGDAIVARHLAHHHHAVARTEIRIVPDSHGIRGSGIPIHLDRRVGCGPIHHRYLHIAGG